MQTSPQSRSHPDDGADCLLGTPRPRNSIKLRPEIAVLLALGDLEVDGDAAYRALVRSTTALAYTKCKFVRCTLNQVTIRLRDEAEIRGTSAAQRLPSFLYSTCHHIASGRHVFRVGSDNLAERRAAISVRGHCRSPI